MYSLSFPINAAIDIKNATIKIKDGFVLTGAVNNGAGYAIGATTMAVDTFVGTITVGDIFTMSGDLQKYTTTAKVDTLGNLTSVTFTPALVIATIDNQVITFLKRELEITVGEGNVTFSEKKPRTYVKNRGLLGTVKNADEEPMDVKFDFTWDFLRADTGVPPTVKDALKKRGNASHWVSSSADPCEPYAVDIEIFYDPECSAEKNERITLEDFRYETLDQDLKNSSVSVSGKCNVLEATEERTTATY